MLAPGSFASGEAVGLPAIVERQQAGQALVSFSYVLSRPAVSLPGARLSSALILVVRFPAVASRLSFKSRAAHRACRNTHGTLA